MGFDFGQTRPMSDQEPKSSKWPTCGVVRGSLGEGATCPFCGKPAEAHGSEPGAKLADEPKPVDCTLPRSYFLSQHGTCARCKRPIAEHGSKPPAAWNNLPLPAPLTPELLTRQPPASARECAAALLKEAESAYRPDMALALANVYAQLDVADAMRELAAELRAEKPQ